jgi:uncharacterized protein YbjT (DUF2867 family)
MILITGSAGKTGRAVLQALLAKGEKVRALVHRPEHLPLMTSLGFQDVVIGEMRHLYDMEQVCEGIRCIYHICPNVSPDEESIGQTVIAAARSARVEHFVFHSVLHPQTEGMPHHWKKLRVEEQLIQSGLSYTILQPAVYMQNILASWESIRDQGVYPIPYPAETRLSFVDLLDVAQAAAIVMTESGHQDAIYELVGTHALSQREVAGILSQRLNRPVTIKVISLSEWEAQARTRGLGDYQIEALTRMFHYYAQYGLSGNPQVLNWLIKKPPSTLEFFIEHVNQQQVQKVN